MHPNVLKQKVMPTKCLFYSAKSNVTYIFPQNKFRNLGLGNLKLQTLWLKANLLFWEQYNLSYMMYAHKWISPMKTSAHATIFITVCQQQKASRSWKVILVTVSENCPEVVCLVFKWSFKDRDAQGHLHQMMVFQNLKRAAASWTTGSSITTMHWHIEFLGWTFWMLLVWSGLLWFLDLPQNQGQHTWKLLPGSRRCDRGSE